MSGKQHAAGQRDNWISLLLPALSLVHHWGLATWMYSSQSGHHPWVVSKRKWWNWPIQPNCLHHIRLACHLLLTFTDLYSEWNLRHLHTALEKQKCMPWVVFKTCFTLLPSPCISEGESWGSFSSQSPLAISFCARIPPTSRLLYFGEIENGCKGKGEMAENCTSSFAQTPMQNMVSIQSLKSCLIFENSFFFYFHKDSLVFPGERKVSKASIFSRPLHHWERIKIFLNVYKIPYCTLNHWHILSSLICTA